MKNVVVLAVVLAAAIAGCKKSDDSAVTPVVVPPVVQENVGGDVSGVWAKGGTYKITNHLQISEGKSLTIQEGATVIFSDSTVKPEFIVKGNLYVLGTDQNPVRFTVPDAWKTAKNEFGNLWGGIIASPKSEELVLKNVIMDYGGAVTTESSPSVKAGLYKAAAGQHVPAVNFTNVNGKVVIINSRLSNQNEDGIYLEGGKVIIANNVIYTQGVSGGDAINIKSGVQADVAYNLVYSPNTNALKLSSTGDRTPQAYVVAYNNTIVNAGWRRPSIKGGSIWVEAAVRATVYNNLFVNDRFGVKRDTKLTEDTRSVMGNNYYYGYTQQGVDQFQPTAEIIAGTNDVIGKKAGDNDPKFVNFPLDNPSLNQTFNTAWNFKLQAGSPALGKGSTTFTRLYADGITVGGVVYQSPAPASYVGAYGTN
ncbi:right-handed parallel beta-helix repeat-containing protein [Fibrella arboris]|uniref:right-handed parallel beta-helix repeat-containing protein n=1 Tax=Fibrella arboris TaxID=3242486 RepID=UPI003521953F